jgi:membrane complex biogenesis BtpA family protein
LEIIKQESDMSDFKSFLKNRKMIIGMIHVQALPGTPDHKLPVSEICRLAVKEARLYKQAGLDAVMLENMHDIPYLNNAAGPEIISAMSLASSAVKKETKLPCGIQILAGANKAALAVAYNCGLDFIRVENFSYAHIADEGVMESCAGELLRYRKYLGADKISIFTDVKKKHSSHAITSDITLEETIRTCQFFLSDGIIITGSSTGIEPDLLDLRKARPATDLPILIGSGITAENITDYWPLTDGFIIGSYFKEQGLWSNQISSQRVKKLMAVVQKLRTEPEE